MYLILICIKVNDRDVIKNYHFFHSTLLEINNSLHIDSFLFQFNFRTFPFTNAFNLKLVWKCNHVHAKHDLISLALEYIFTGKKIKDDIINKSLDRFIGFERFI